MPLKKLVDSMCYIPTVKELIRGNHRLTTDSFMDTHGSMMGRTYQTSTDTVGPRRLAHTEVVIDPEMFEYFEKQISNAFMHAFRVKLATRSESEIIADIESFRKRFKQYFRIARLDSMVASLSDRDKLRAYTNLHMQPTA